MVLKDTCLSRIYWPYRSFEKVSLKLLKGNTTLHHMIEIISERMSYIRNDFSKSCLKKENESLQHISLNPCLFCISLIS